MFATVMIVVVLLVVVGYIVLDIRRRLPRGGLGPRIGYIPRPLRPALNRLCARRGWPQPFDENGDRVTPR